MIEEERIKRVHCGGPQQTGPGGGKEVWVDDEGHILARAGIAAFILAAVMVGIILVRNWLAFEVVASAVEQPPYVFPTTQIQSPYMLTPWAVGTPWYEFNFDYWPTATPTMEGGVYIWNP